MLKADLTRQAYSSHRERYKAYYEQLRQTIGDRATRNQGLEALSKQTYRQLQNEKTPPLTLQEAGLIEAVEEPHNPAELATMARETLIAAMARELLDRKHLTAQLAVIETADQLEAKLQGAKMTMWEYTAVEQAIFAASNSSL